MKINVYSIEKNRSDDFSKLIQNHKKMIQKYAQIEEITIFNKKTGLNLSYLYENEGFKSFC